MATRSKRSSSGSDDTDDNGGSSSALTPNPYMDTYTPPNYGASQPNVWSNYAPYGLDLGKFANIYPDYWNTYQQHQQNQPQSVMGGGMPFVWGLPQAQQNTAGGAVGPIPGQGFNYGIPDAFAPRAPQVGGPGGPPAVPTTPTPPIDPEPDPVGSSGGGTRTRRGSFPNRMKLYDSGDRYLGQVRGGTVYERGGGNVRSGRPGSIWGKAAYYR